MKSFREYLRESKSVETEYQKFFRKKLEKYGVMSPSELSDEDKKEFFSEIEKEWTGDEEDNENNDVNEALSEKQKEFSKLYSDVFSSFYLLNSFIRDNYGIELLRKSRRLTDLWSVKFKSEVADKILD